jgi:hypothetical protein
VNAHYVLVTGEVGNVFTINDPGDLTDNYLDPAGGTKYTTFTTRGFISDPTDRSGLEVSAVGAGNGVRISVTNAQGQITGRDPVTGLEDDQIPGSVEYTDGLESDEADDTAPVESNDVVFIPTAQAGAYTISVTGVTSTEPFTLMAYGEASDGAVEPAVVDTGTATPGAFVTFATTFSPQAPVSLSESTIVVSPDTIAGGSTGTVTLTARDDIGNQLPSGGLTVSFGLGTGTGSGTFGPITDNGNGTYTAIFTGTAAGNNTITATINGQALTPTAPLVTVAISPIVTTNPTSQAASAGNPVSFIAAAVGRPAPTVQWQVSTDDGNTFTNIAGANSATFTTTASADDNGYAYQAVFTNSSDSATTTPAFLTVNTTPASLVISAATGVSPQFNLVEPPGTEYFGSQIVPLSTGNIVVTSVGSEGAAYLFNGQTGALISALTGLGTEGPIVTALTNGNYVVASPDWDNGVGAVTWGNGTTGISGTPSAANSLIGSTVFDHVGGWPGAGGGITVLTNGNYVVDSPNWGSNGSASDGLGAVTWGNGWTGTSGVVSAANSLVGSTVYDLVGGSGGVGSGVTALTNGNYVVDSETWGSNATQDGLGAVTWGNGTTGTSGAVSAANSLVGSLMGDTVGSAGVTALTNGNYVVDSEQWNGEEGAVTWGNGTTGISGAVSASNSLVGGNAAVPAGGEPDFVGSGSVTALTNGNYVVNSPNFSADASTGQEIGAVTWGNGGTGISGAVSTANSLVGANLGDSVGGGYGQLLAGVTALTNGNYVVDSPWWGTVLSENANVGAIPLGAVTWENGTTAATGTVNASNSLVGSLVGSTVANGVGGGGVTALTNGNYVVDSYNWNYGQGAVTWGNGTTGTTGTISAANSLVGSFLSDQIGAGGSGGDGQGGVTALANGNYVVDSPDWYAQTGAVTWGNGTTGSSGTISAANSLVGNTVGNAVGASILNGVTGLANGNYVVLTPNEATATWGNGTTGTQGTLATAQSLTGVGGSVVAVNTLPNGDYVVSVNNGNGNASDTWVNGASGVTLDGQNTIDAQNSLMGVAGAVPLLGGSAFLATNAVAGTATVGFTDPNLLTYALAQGQTINITPDFLTQSLDVGTNVTLQSNDDIIVNSPITVNPTGTPGSLTLQAGRSILINANINTAGGNLTLTANDTVADGVINSERDPGNATIEEQSGVTINTGAGALSVNLVDSTDKTNNGSGGVARGYREFSFSRSGTQAAVEMRPK